MKKYLIAYGVNSGSRAMNNPTILLSATDEDDALDLFYHLKGFEHKIQLIKKVDY